MNIAEYHIALLSIETAISTTIEVMRKGTSSNIIQQRLEKVDKFIKKTKTVNISYSLLKYAEELDMSEMV